MQKWALDELYHVSVSIVMDWMGKMLKLPSAFLFSGNDGGVEK